MVSDPEEWIRDALLAYAPLKALVGQRVCPGKLPQRAANEKFEDGCVYSRVSTRRSDCAEGYGGTTDVVVELAFWSLDYANAKQMAKAAVACLMNHQGNHDGLPIQRTHVANEFDKEVLVEDESDALLYARVLHVEVDFDENVSPQD